MSADPPREDIELRSPRKQPKKPAHLSGDSQASEGSSTSDGHIEDVNEPYGLRELERGWQFLQPFIHENGYVLRPRYWPGWKGSWVGNDLNPLACEDSIVVVILKIHTPLNGPDNEEIEILRYLSSSELASDPRNHCVPLLDVLEVEGHSPVLRGVRIAVLPLFRDWYEPRFNMVVEALSFIKQMLEGLDFMHAHDVAHRNIISRNILMDASALYPQGFHGAFNMNTSHRVSEAGLLHHTRLEVPVKYYFIDFGTSVRFPNAPERRLVSQKHGSGTDFVLPELRENGQALYDPFKADVYALGRLLDHFFYKGHTGVEFLRPLFLSMLHDRPDQRPSAAECVEHYTHIVKGLSRRQMRAKLGFRVPVSWAERVDNFFGYWKLWWIAVAKGRTQLFDEV
ncbi:hypothetical protein BV25DRAFT_1839864 [Artomyces pyxidatus]|uniref:Uncharacterized protein n=1 Tax=Artomyces pyxidatus TaxID=48021 RepID=A0ACB8SVA4_9AGAM|nr:hypothetical protein BV25DRAFT_1839864 [Artomyces pyxidatus]